MLHTHENFNATFNLHVLLKAVRLFITISFTDIWIAKIHRVFVRAEPKIKLIIKLLSYLRWLFNTQNKVSNCIF